MKAAAALSDVDGTLRDPAQLPAELDGGLLARLPG